MLAVPRFPSTGLTVAIIGMGPRGLSVFERLVARLRQEAGPRPIHILTIDPDEHGAGRIWRTDQPEWLLMNTTIGQITIYADTNESPAMGPSLYEWLHAQPDGRYAHFGRNDYVPRAVYGRYLCDAYRHIASNLPEGADVQAIHDRVAAIRPYDGRYQLTFLRSRESLEADIIVLATGHPNNLLTSAEQEFQRHADAHNLTYIPSDSVASMDLSVVKPTDVVAVRGMGLTFYDLVAELTQGRGGVFTQEPDGNYRYHPSGEEPKIVAGSRSGLPFLARGKNQKTLKDTYQPSFLTLQALETLRQRARVQRGSPMLDFKTEVYPLIEREMQLVYYHRVLRARDGQAVADAFVRQFVQVAAYPEERDALLMEFALTDVSLPTLEQLARPFANQHFAHPEDFIQHLIAHLQQDIAEAEGGNIDNPLKSALDVPRDIRSMICASIDFSGLLPSSQREFEWEFAPSIALVSTGPPLFRLRELIALIEAGVVTVVGPNTRFICDTQNQCFTVLSPQVAGSVQHATVLIEARVPDPRLPYNASLLYRQLLADGLISEYVSVNPDNGERLQTGGLAVTPAPYNVIDCQGRSNQDIYAIGIPIEHTLWFTQVGSSRPASNTQFSREADAIACGILRRSMRSTTEESQEQEANVMANAAPV